MDPRKGGGDGIDLWERGCRVVILRRCIPEMFIEFFFLEYLPGNTSHMHAGTSESTTKMIILFIWMQPE